MIAEKLDKLLAMVGEPYEEPEGCMKFLTKALAVLGVEIEGTTAAYDRDLRFFIPTDNPRFGTVIVWKNPSFISEYKFHVGLMLDQRWAIQCSKATNGVAKVEITRPPWSQSERHLYYPKALCS